MVRRPPDILHLLWDGLDRQAKKEFPEQLAIASGMEYCLIKATDANTHRIHLLM